MAERAGVDAARAAGHEDNKGHTGIGVNLARATRACRVSMGGRIRMERMADTAARSWIRCDLSRGVSRKAMGDRPRCASRAMIMAMR